MQAALEQFYSPEFTETLKTRLGKLYGPLKSHFG